MTLPEDLTPAQLGMPRKFTEFRNIQREMAEYALYSPTGDPEDCRRFTCMGAPPGSGKTLIKHMIGALASKKYISLTATRSLEDQEISDRFDLVNIRGRRNYGCLDDDATDAWTCEDGEKNNCDLYGTADCTYQATVLQAKSHRAVLTNYQYWMNARVNRGALEEDGGVDPIEWMFCDEAHLILSELTRHLSVWVGNTDFRHYANDEHRVALAASKGAEWGKVGEKWLEALGAAAGRIAAVMAEIADEYPNVAMAKRLSAEYRKLDKLKGGMERVLRFGKDENWIWRYAGGGIGFDCIWPGKYAEWFLWSGVPRIVLLSATLRPKALQLAYIAKAERWYKEWPRVFPAHLSPVVWVKTDPPCKMGVNASEEEKGQSVKLLDEMARLWEGRRGIVHTPSYELAEWFEQKARCSRRMILNRRDGGAKGTREAAEKYRKAPGGILMSPSYHTGHDFADEACEWQFIPKLPWPSKGNPLVQARMADDDQYYNSETMQRFQQSCFRGTRHEMDECTTLVGDHAVGNFRRYAADHCSKWFRVSERKTVPGPPS